METKDLLGLTLLLLGTFSGAVLASLSQGARDLAFFVLVAGGGFAERLNIEFASHYWYRGTTRGVEFSFVDILAVSLLVGCALFPRDPRARRFWPISLAPMILYFFYACFSVAISDPKVFGFFELTKIIRGAIVFLAAAWYVQSEREMRLLVLALSCAVGLEALFAFKQRFVSGIFRVTGTLDHANSFSIYLCSAVPVLAAAFMAPLERWLRAIVLGALAAATVSSLLTVSRAGIPVFFFILAGTAMFTGFFRLNARCVLATAGLGVGLIVLFASQWQNLAARFEIERSLEEEYFDERSEGRGHYFLLAKAILDDQFLGVGLNNWSYWICKKYGAERGWSYQNYDDLDYIPPKEALSDYLYAPPAHNLAALTAGELGWPGLLIFLWVWMRWFRAGAHFLRRRSADLAGRLGVGCFFSVTGVFLQCVTEWVYRQTPIMFTFHVVLGVLASLYYHRRKAQPRLAEETDLFTEESRAFELEEVAVSRG